MGRYNSNNTTILDERELDGNTRMLLLHRHESGRLEYIVGSYFEKHWYEGCLGYSHMDYSWQWGHYFDNIVSAAEFWKTEVLNAMNLLDFKNYERMTVEECWAKYTWGCEAKRGSTVYRTVFDDGRKEVFVDELKDATYGGDYACEFFYDGGLEGQWFADTKEDAVRGAIIDSVGMTIMREEDNCEDAVNSIAREAYVMLFGDCDMLSMKAGEVDELLRIAREFVKSHAESVGYEWEEF